MQPQQVSERTAQIIRPPRQSAGAAKVIRTAKLTGCLQIDGYLEFNRLLDGQIHGLDALEDLVDEGCGLFVQDNIVGRQRYQRTGKCRLTVG
jgi:hypothetical protein